MIKKERKPPLQIRKLTALLRRLPPTHPKRPQIKEKLARYNAGYRGEQSIEYYLSFLPEKSYLIFHDLRLAFRDHFFQLDTLLVSPFFILILEVKNISGTLYFDDTFHQLIRTIDGTKEGFNDPLLQVEHQKTQLANWLQQHKFSPVPIQTLVVISNPGTIIQASEGNSQRLKRVTRSPDLCSRIEQLAQDHQIEKLSKTQLRRLSNQLIKKHTPYNPDFLQQFSIPKKDLLKGVHCPECFALPMVRKHSSWVCPICGQLSKSAHLHSLQDYALLLGSDITNSQLRDFLQLSSRSIATNILTSMNLEHSGTNRGRKYQLSFYE